MQVKVGTLTPWPDVNMGQQILIRLRPAHSPDTFYDQEDIVQTMLHEVRTQLTSFFLYNSHPPT